MEKSQFELCVEILKRLEGEGVLRDVILVGSWCSLFFKDYFGADYHAVIRTRDMDFLVPTPSRIQSKTDVPKLLSDLGFVVGFMGPQGYMRLEHPELIVEFLVPERGRAADAPCE